MIILIKLSPEEQEELLAEARIKDIFSTGGTAWESIAGKILRAREDPWQEES